MIVIVAIVSVVVVCLVMRQDDPVCRQRTAFRRSLGYWHRDRSGWFAWRNAIRNVTPGVTILLVKDRQGEASTGMKAWVDVYELELDGHLLKVDSDRDAWFPGQTIFYKRLVVAENWSSGYGPHSGRPNVIYTGLVRELCRWSTYEQFERFDKAGRPRPPSPMDFGLTSDCKRLLFPPVR